MLGGMLLTTHNLHYYQDLMAELRDAIEAGRMAEYAAAFATDATDEAAQGETDEES